MQADPGLGKLYWVPNSDKLSCLCWTKQEMYHRRFMRDTHVFFGFMRDENGELLYARVYPVKVPDSIRVRDLPIWIRFTHETKLPKSILEETPFQFDDPAYLIRRIQAEKNIRAFQDSIDSLCASAAAWA